MNSNLRTRSVLALGALTSTLVVSLSSCSIYQSSDREEFNKNAVSGAVDSESFASTKGCNTHLTEEAASRIFGSPDVQMESMTTEDGSLSCRVSLQGLSSTENQGASLASCTFPKDAAVLLNDGIDVLNRGTSWKIQPSKNSSAQELVVAKRRAIDDTTVVCRFQFATRAELDQSFELVRTRGIDLTTAFLNR